MTSIAEAMACLERAASLAEILVAGRQAFELMLHVIESLQDPSGGAFTDFVVAATYAANGRDALLFAPSMPDATTVRPRVAGPSSPLGMAIDLKRLSDLLADRLADGLEVAAHQDDARACAEGQNQANRLAFLLTGLIDP